MIKSYTQEKVACGELNIIFSDMKSREVSKNLNISKSQSMLEQRKEVALQWEEKWKVLQSKQHALKQEVDDASKRMRDLEKALLEESHMMHERQILKTEFFEFLKEKEEQIDFNQHKFGQTIESDMFKIWTRQEVKDLQSAMEQMHWKDLSNIEEV